MLSGDVRVQKRVFPGGGRGGLGWMPGSLSSPNNSICALRAVGGSFPGVEQAARGLVGTMLDMPRIHDLFLLTPKPCRRPTQQELVVGTAGALPRPPSPGPGAHPPPCCRRNDC